MNNVQTGRADDDSFGATPTKQDSAEPLSKLALQAIRAGITIEVPEAPFVPNPDDKNFFSTTVNTLIKNGQDAECAVRDARIATILRREFLGS